MKPVMFYAGTFFDLVVQLGRIRAAAKQAIETSGAARITVEPASPSVVAISPPKNPKVRPPMMAAARVAK